MTWCAYYSVFINFLYNWQIFIALFYLYFYRRMIKDPSQHSLGKEIAIFLGLIIPSVGLAYDSGIVACEFYHSIDQRQLPSRIYSTVVSFWSVLTLPLFWYFRCSLKQGCNPVQLTMLRSSINWIYKLIYAVTLEIIYYLIINVIRIYINYQRDQLI